MFWGPGFFYFGGGRGGGGVGNGKLGIIIYQLMDLSFLMFSMSYSTLSKAV